MRLYSLLMCIVFAFSGYACEYTDSLISRILEREKIDSLEVDYFIPKYASEIKIHCVSLKDSCSFRFDIESFNTAVDNIAFPNSVSPSDIALLASQIALSKPTEVYLYRKKTRKICESDFPGLFIKIFKKGREKPIVKTIWVGDVEKRQKQLVLNYIVEYSDHFMELINKLDSVLFHNVRF